MKPYIVTEAPRLKRLVRRIAVPLSKQKVSSVEDTLFGRGIGDKAGHSPSKVNSQCKKVKIEGPGV